MRLKSILIINRAPFDRLEIDLGDENIILLSGINGAVLASGVHDHKVSGKTSQLLSEYNEPKKSK